MPRRNAPPQGDCIPNGLAVGEVPGTVFRGTQFTSSARR